MTSWIFIICFNALLFLMLKLFHFWQTSASSSWVLGLFDIPCILASDIRQPSFILSFPCHCQWDSLGARVGLTTGLWLALGLLSEQSYTICVFKRKINHSILFVLPTEIYNYRALNLILFLYLFSLMLKILTLLSYWHNKYLLHHVKIHTIAKWNQYHY